MALARDGAAPFLNPATMGRIADHKVAFSVRFYRDERVRITDFFRAPYQEPEFEDGDVDRAGFTSAPSSFCAFITLSRLIPEESDGWLASVRASSGRTKLGLCGATIDSEDFDLSADGLSESRPNGRATTAVDVRRAFSRSSFGPSLSYQLTDTLSLGASVHMVSTSASLSWETTSIVVDGDQGGFTAHSLSARGGASNLVALLGMTWARGIQTFGVSVRLPSIAVSGSARASRFTAQSGAPAELVLGTGDFSAPPPPTFAIGTGVEWPRLLLEVDAITTLGAERAIETQLDSVAYVEDDAAAAARTERVAERTRTTTSLRMGGEWFFYPTLSVLAGGRVEPSALVGPIDGPELRFGQARVHSVAGSLGIGSYGRGAELLVGAELSHRWGQTVAFTPGHPEQRFDATPMTDTTVMFVLSGGLSLTSLRRAVRNVEQFGRERIPGLDPSHRAPDESGPGK